MKKLYDIIGGPSHGETAEVEESATSLESPVYTDEARLKEPLHSETYTKRRFTGEEFHSGYECFGIVTDDDTDTRELARMELNAPAVDGKLQALRESLDPVHPHFNL